ncbi:MAG: O-antigen polymerase [Novosphingobium sp.]
MYPVLLYLSLAIFAAVCVSYARQDFASIFHPISFYLLFHGFIFVIRPLFAYYGEYNLIYGVYQFRPTMETKIAVIVAANLGLLAFVGGAAWTGNAPMVFKQTALHLEQRRRMIPAFLAAMALLVPLGVASLRNTMTTGFVGMVRIKGTGVTVNTTANGWFIDAQLLLVPCAMLFAWMFRFRWWSLLPLFGFIVGRATTGSRGPFIVACVAAGLAYLYERRMRYPDWRIVATLYLLVTAFVRVGDDRGRAVRSWLEDGQASEAVQSRTPFMKRMDFANLEFIEFIVHTIPEKTGTYGYFLDNLQVFTEPIPRKLWKGKPVGPPIELYNLFDHGNPIGMTSSLPGQGWAQLGYLGVLIWCGLWGLLLGKAYSKFARGSQDTVPVALYLCFLPIFVIAFRDGGLLTVVRSGAFYLAPVLLMALFARWMGVPPFRLIEQAAVRARRGSRPGASEIPPPPQERPPVGSAAGRRAAAASPVIVPRSQRPRGPAPAE